MAEMANFDGWTDEVERAFCSALSDDQRLKLLRRLIGSCPGYLLVQLSEHLESISKRDFVRLLPDCARDKLISYLDVETLLTACEVSQSWNSVISVNRSVWRNLCKQNDFLVPAELSDKQLADLSFFKNLYVKGVTLVKHLTKGFDAENEPILLKGHSQEISAMYYYDGKLATGSRDATVRIWCCASGDCLATFSTHCANSIKFDDQFIVTTSLDQSAACWDISNGTKLRSYNHAKRVFSVDYNTHIDILVTGLDDSIVMIWSFTDGVLLHTLGFTNVDGFRLIVDPVKIWGEVDCLLNPLETFHIFANNGSAIIDYEVRLSTTVVEKEDVLFSSEDCELFTMSQFDDSSLQFMSSKDNSSGSLKISLGCIDFCGRILIAKRPNNRIHHLPISNGDASYLGSGAYFDAFVGREFGGLQWCLYVVGHNSEMNRFTFDLPERSSSARICHVSQICICDTKWLDGISEEAFCGRALVAVATSDNSIKLLKLKPLKY